MGVTDRQKLKREREQGLQALEDTALTENQILATAKLHQQVFEKVDEYSNKQFCKQMQDWRDNHQDIYVAFWWWRRAYEKAGGRDADDFGVSEPKYRVFEVMQYLARPFDFAAWENDRRTLKPGVTPFITEEQIEKGLEHRTIKRWLWLWHNRDVYTPEDEITDTRGLMKAGDAKFVHSNVVIEVSPALPISTVARWFGVPPQYVQKYSGRGAFMERVAYAFHETQKAMDEGKTHYEYDEAHASPGFDYAKELSEYHANRARYGRRAAELTPADCMRLHVLEDGWTLRDCKREDPITYSKIQGSLNPLRLDYLMDQPPQPLRLNIYVDGDSAMGKSSFCEWIAETIFEGYANPAFWIGNDDRVVFDGYDGEPCIIWEEMRAVDFIAHFKRSGALRLLDVHPKKQAQQVKHSRVLLTNSVNIINGIEPYEEFLDGLAGKYIDKKGIQHEAEDDVQVYRRMPMILCIRQNDFDILVNKGFLNHDAYAFKQYMQYQRVTGSIRKVLEGLGGDAKEVVKGSLSKPVAETVKMLSAAHDDKIVEVDQIPAEFANYGTVMTAEEVAEAEKQALEAHWLAEQNAMLERMESDYAEFREYLEWLDEFALLDAAEKAGKAAMPEGWRRGHTRPEFGGVTYVPSEEEAALPLTFAGWKYVIKGERDSFAEIPV